MDTPLLILLWWALFEGLHWYLSTLASFCRSEWFFSLKKYKWIKYMFCIILKIPLFGFYSNVRVGFRVIAITLGIGCTAQFFTYEYEIHENCIVLTKLFIFWFEVVLKIAKRVNILNYFCVLNNTALKSSLLIEAKIITNIDWKVRCENPQFMTILN